ncbi:hypothetical protein CSA37_05580 [Candidatus Fermentibacteria bacterium]|nr:MAG: hypothetical protein CSA37_05580 [Candidatus Fermentibacteria bacterium]
MPGENDKLIKQISRSGSESSIKCCYGDGPGGYTVHLALTKAGIDCKVTAPSLILKQRGKRVKKRQA